MPAVPHDSAAGAPAAPAAPAPRASIRAFLDRPVPDALLHRLLVAARSAPSAANLQPGEFVRVDGDARARLSGALVAAFASGRPAQEDYGYFPDPMPQALRRRQVAAARALYGALGIDRDDAAGRAAQFARNYRFFDAPVALVVTLDRRLGAGCFLDLGMCLHALMTAAAAEGLGSCAIGALASYPDVVREALGLGAGRLVVCGMALGWPDPAAPENAVRTGRRPLDDFFTVIR
jgi:nitroreductase